MKPPRSFGLLISALILLINVGEVRAADQADRAARGEDLFDRWCQPCHGAGPQYPGTMALKVRLGEKRSVLLERDDLVKPYVEFVIRNGFQMMPPFRPTELSEKNIGEIWEYLASGRGKGNGGKSKDK